MSKALEKKLAAARVRCAANRVLVHAAWVLAGAGLAAAVAVAVERTFGVALVGPVAAWALAGAAVATVVGLSLLRLPRRMEVALLLDRRLALRERFSTALALAGSEDPFARAATAEADRAAARVDVARRFPVRPTKHWAAALAAWVLAGGVFWLLPADLLGYVAARSAVARRAEQIRTTEAEVELAAGKVQAAVRLLNDPQVAEEAELLAKITRAGASDQVRREAIRKLTDLADRLRQVESSPHAAAGEMLRKMLSGLRTTPDALNDELSRALASGDFRDAAKMLRHLLRQANEGGLSEEDKKRLAEQLKDLADQLDRLAAGGQQQREQMLQRQGMDAETARKLAGLSEQELREQLRQQGMDDKQIDELMKKLAAAQQACRSGQRLSEKLAGCSGQAGSLVPDGLRDLAETLDGMAGELVDRKTAEQALDEVEAAIARLGSGDGPAPPFDPNMLGDPNAPVAWQAGGQLRPGRGGGGGRGRAWGLRPTAKAGTVGHKATGVKNAPPKERDAEIVASWLFKGPQVKGVSRRELTRTVQAAGQAAAEAVGRNEIPRKYAAAVKKYFGGFEGRLPADANQP